MLMAPGGIGRVGRTRRTGAATAAIVPPYSADSYWNVPIPASPPLHASSAAYVTKLTSWGSGNPQAVQAGQHGGVDDFSVPVYTALASDPLVTIATTVSNARTQQVNGSQIRLPAAAVAAGGSDAHLVCTQPDGWVFEAFAVASISGGTLTCNMAGRSRQRGEGFDSANAYASKTGALGGRITTAEWLAAAAGTIQNFGHAIAIMIKSTDGTMVWPSYGLAGVGDTVNAPPCGAWFQATWTLSEIDAMSISNVAKAYLRTAVLYGLIVMDTTGNNGSWIPRSVGNDRADSVIGNGTPFKDHAIAAGVAGGWFLDTGIYYWTELAGLAWSTHLRVLDPTYMKGLFDARIAYKRLDPAATVSNNWTLTGAATAHECLTETTLAPGTPTTTLRIGDNTLGEVAEVRMGTLTIPQGKTLSALVLSWYGNTQAASNYSGTIKSGATVLAAETMPLNKTTRGWWQIVYNGGSAGLDLADLRARFEMLATGTFSNNDQAYLMAEFA